MPEEEDLATKIASDVKKTGFPLEVAIANQLREAGWDVTHQGFYRDPERNASHTIDLVASKLAIYPTKLPNRLTTTLLVECKKRSKKPWVFFSRDIRREDIDLSSLTEVQFVADDFQRIAQWHSLMRTHYFNPGVKHSAIALEAFSKGRNKGTYEAIIQVVFATLHHKELYREVMHQKGLGVDLSNALMLLYPVIVFDGPMYELKMDSSGELHATPIDHVVHLYSYGDSSKFSIDVVKKEYFSVFLQSIEVESISL